MTIPVDYAKIRLRRDTTANWTAENPVLDDGEIALERQLSGQFAFRVGDGSSTWTELGQNLDLTVTWAAITETPTTLAGYGITDAYTTGQTDTVAANAASAALSGHTNAYNHASYDSHLSSTSNPHSVTKAQVGLGSVENTALSTWAGSTALTTLGTIGTGTWQGSAIADGYISSAATWSAKVAGAAGLTNVGRLVRVSAAGTIGETDISIGAADGVIARLAGLQLPANVGIGTAVNTAYGITLTKALTESDGAWLGSVYTITRTTASTSSNGTQGVYSALSLAPAVSTSLTSTTSNIAGYFETLVSGAGTVAHARGTTSRIGFTTGAVSGTTATNLYGHYVLVTRSGTGWTCDNLYALRITEAGTAGTIYNYWGLYEDLGTGAKNYLKNPLLIGTTAAVGSELVRVAGGTAATPTATDVTIGGGSVRSGADSYFNTVRVGLGGGATATHTCVGAGAMAATANGGQVTAVGNNAFASMTSGRDNTSIGYAAGNAITTGSYNTVVGASAARYHADGVTTLTDPEQSVYIGALCRGKDNSDSNSIVIGYNAIGQGANTAVWGNTSITNHYFTGALNSGDVAGGNYLKVESNGTLVFNGNATVWEDINIDLSPLQTGGTAPGFATIASTNIRLRAFAVNEDVDGSFEIPHSYKLGSNITAHIHFLCDSAPTGTDQVKWQLEYYIVNAGGTVSTSTTIDTGDVAVDTQWKRVDADFTLSITNASLGGQVAFKLKRIAATGDAYAGECAVQTFGFHYEQDTVGSRQITTK